MIKINTAENFIRDFRSKGTEKTNPEIIETVAKILEDIKIRGDKAVKEYEKKFDGVDLEELEVSEAEKSSALKIVGKDFIKILERAAKNIYDFHSKQLRNGFMFSNSDGVILGQRVIPLEKVGLYVPGGTASYPSTVLMNAIPAKIAGCENIIVTTPPEIKPEIIAASHVAGVDRIYKIGGAQAVAALAFGTESVMKVDKIVGPGNIFVAEAKRQVFGHVAIDMIAGPSEILIIADEKNSPSNIAADLLAQAEHDRLASSILITDSKILAERVRDEIENQITKLERHDIARASIDNNGAVILVETLKEAENIANEIAPEHLELCVENPFESLTRIKNAGSVFLGKYSPEALGDYYAGANHTLPTMGTARFSSPLSVDDFVKKSQYIYYNEDALKKVSDDIEAFAKSEGLTGHANSITIRKCLQEK